MTKEQKSVVKGAVSGSSSPADMHEDGGDDHVMAQEHYDAMVHSMPTDVSHCVEDRVGGDLIAYFDEGLITLQEVERHMRVCMEEQFMHSEDMMDEHEVDGHHVDGDEGEDTDTAGEEATATDSQNTETSFLDKPFFKYLITAVIGALGF